MSSFSSDIATTRKEALFVVVVWLACCLYVVGYAALFAYQPASANRSELPPLVFGMPSWAFWGVIVPWCVCTGITIWFATVRMRDVDLGEEKEGDTV